MSTRIDEREMTDSATSHRAVVVDGADQYDTGAWRVSWLRDVALDRDQAITAMTLVRFVALGVTSVDHPKWPFVKGWAYELDLDPAEVVRMILAKTDDEVVTGGQSGSFTCPKCQRTSHHPKDVEYGYCGACHEYTGADRDRG